MNEYAEEYEDEDESIYDEIDDLEDQLDEQEEIAEINHQIQQLQAAHGAPFSQDEIQQIGELIDEGYTPESVYEAVAPSHPAVEAFDNQFVETIEHVQQQQGRPLANSEVQNLYEQATYLGDPRYVDDEAVRDLGTRKGRIAHANERIAEKDPPAEAPEVIEPLAEDATGKDRAAYIDARMAGAEVDTDSYEIGEE